MPMMMPSSQTGGLAAALQPDQGGLLQRLLGTRAQSGLGQRLTDILDPRVALPMAGAMMAGRTPQAGFGDAMTLGGFGLGKLNESRKSEAEKNRAKAYLAAKHPELAQMVDMGMPVQDAFSEALKLDNGGGTEATSGIKEYEYAKRNGFQGTFMDWQNAGKVAADSRPSSVQEYEYSQQHPGYAEYQRTSKGRDSTLMAGDRAAIRESEDVAQAGNNTVQVLEGILKDTTGPGTSLNDRASYGATANSQAWMARNDPTGLFDDQKGEATTELQNAILTNALGSMKAIFGGNPTEGERQILIDLQASVDKTPAERKIILQRAIEMAKRKTQFHMERANELRSGSYYKEGGGLGNGAPPVGDGVVPPTGGGYKVLSVE